MRTWPILHEIRDSWCCSVSQCVAVCYNAWLKSRCVAVCRSVSQCGPVRSPGCLLNNEEICDWYYILTIVIILTWISLSPPMACKKISGNWVMIFDAVFVVHTYVIVLLWFIRMYIDILHSCLELMILCRTCSTSDPAARARAHTYTHTYKHKTHTHTHNTLSLTHTRTHTYNTHTHTHTNTHTHTHTHTHAFCSFSCSRAAPPICFPHLLYFSFLTLIS